MGTSTWDMAKTASQQRLTQQRQIAEQQRLQRQNTVGMQLLDSINQASNIKPTTKDEQGNIIPNPAYDQAQKDRAQLMAQYSALNSPEQHASFAQHLHGLIFGHPTPHPQQPALNPDNPAEPSATAAPQSGQGPTQVVAPASPPHPFEKGNPLLDKIGEGINALGDHLKAFAQPLPKPAEPDTALMAKYYRDPAEVAFERNKELWGVRGQNALDLQEKKNEYLKAMLQARPPRLLSQTTIPDLLEQMKVDPTMSIYGPNGSELTPAQLAEMPAGTVAREFRAGTQIFYALGDQNSKTLKVGNEVYAIPALGPITPENSTALGVATPGAVATHQVPGMNPGEVVTLHNTRTPETTGMTTPPAATPVAPPSGGAPQLLRRPDAVPPAPAPVNPGARAPGTIPSGAAVKSKPLSSGTLDINSAPPAFAKGTMLTQGRAAQPVVSAMSVVGANIFGNGGEKPIWENAWMYDKPELRTALNKALTLNALKNPGTEDNPSLMQTLATSVGVTGWSQEQVNQAAVEARQEVERLGGPEALKQFAREAAMQEDLPALRAATKASAAQGSLALAVRAAPVYNISSAQDFRNQLSTLLSTATSSMKGYPAINPEYVKWWERGTAAARGGPVSSKAPKIPDASERPANVPAGYVLRDGPKGRGWYAPTAK